MKKPANFSPAASSLKPNPLPRSNWTREAGQGRRHILLKFDKPAPAELIAQGQAKAEIELDLAWEFAEEEFGFADLARDYFSESATMTEQPPHCSVCMTRRTTAAQAGPLQKAPAEILQQALAAIEKKKQIQAQIDSWAKSWAR
ncbi:hypothetical protein J4714_13450 [Staphylococcus epidermidis]|nr:hypothetical protein [Staphylococcus epidermidis]